MPCHEANNAFAEDLQAQIRQMSAEICHTLQVQNAVMEDMNMPPMTMGNSLMSPNSAANHPRTRYSYTMAELRSISSGVQRRDFAAAPASATPTRDPATPQVGRLQR